MEMEVGQVAKTKRDLFALQNKPSVLKFKALSDGLAVKSVMGKRILVIPIESYTDMDRVEKSGKLFIPESVREKNQPPPSSGVVVQIGTGCDCDENKDENGELIVREGSMVLFSKYAGAEFIIDQKSYKVLDLVEVLCTLEDTKGAVALIKEGGEDGTSESAG